ncbi:MAG TPA: class I lanthipeptide [Panacibacter sp.]|nr:class I lanthipeptide [Panacibacter sp.]
MKPKSNKPKSSLIINRQTITKLNSTAMGQVHGAAAAQTTKDLSLILLNCYTSCTPTGGTANEGGVYCPTIGTLA